MYASRESCPKLYAATDRYFDHLRSVCWKAGDVAEHIREKNVVVKITEVNESWFKCFVISDCSYMKNTVYCFFYGDFRKVDKVDFNHQVITVFGIKSSIAYLKQAAEKVDEAKRNTMLEQLDDIKSFLLD